MGVEGQGNHQIWTEGLDHIERLPFLYSRNGRLKLEEKPSWCQEKGQEYKDDGETAGVSQPSTRTSSLIVL